MKQFNLQEYLTNPSRQVVTREGKKVRIVCTDRKGLCTKPIVALITLPNGDEIVKCFWEDGIETRGVEENIYDLFFAPEKHEGWINIYAYINDNSYPGNHIFKSKEEAIEAADNYNYVSTIKIEWED